MTTGLPRYVETSTTVPGRVASSSTNLQVDQSMRLGVWAAAER